MKKLSNNAGLTLVELIVSSVLLSVILLGIVSFNSSLKQIQSNNITTTTSNYQASVAMSFLRNDIAMATGDSSNLPNSSGISMYISGGNTSLCLRQPDSTPMNYNDNFWNCYLYDSSSQNLIRCEAPKSSVSPTVVPFNPQTTTMDTLTECTTNAASIIYLAKLQYGIFFPTSYVSGNPIPITLYVADGSSVYRLSSTFTPLNHTQ